MEGSTFFLIATISLIVAQLTSTINGQYNPYYPNYYFPNYPIYYQGYPPNINLGQCPTTLVAPTNGYITNSCINTIGYTCTFSCASGYTLSGSSSITCLAPGYWSASTPTCASSSRRVIGYLAIPNRWG